MTAITSVIYATRAVGKLEMFIQVSDELSTKEVSFAFDFRMNGVDGARDLDHALIPEYSRWLLQVEKGG